jgi:hypothetical protein
LDRGGRVGLRENFCWSLLRTEKAKLEKTKRNERKLKKNGNYP